MNRESSGFLIYMNSINLDTAEQVSMKLLCISPGAGHLSAIFSFLFSANLSWTLLNENFCFSETDLQSADLSLGNCSALSHWPFLPPPFSLTVVQS